MFQGDRHPWLVSAGLHGILGGLVLAVVLSNPEPTPPALRMHIVGGQAAAPGPTRSGRDAAVVPTPPGRPGDPGLPGWRPLNSHSLTEVPLAVPSTLDELLGAVGTPPQDAAPSEAGLGMGWSNASGEGYAPPPLPPPGIAPPQGARWTLTISVPAGGGGATSIDGLDSGHPELDRWLEDYLRSVSFPASLEGSAYQTRWHLRLNSGKPQ